MLSLGWARGLRHYQLIALLGVTHDSRGNSASKFQGLEVLSSKTPYKQHPQRNTRWRCCELYALRAIPYRRTYESQNFFFWFMSDVVLQETHLITSRLLREFLRGDLQAKVVPETNYLSRFWRSHAWVPQASLQADSALTCRQEKKPQDPRRTSWPWEKGRGAISPDSHASHPLHSYAVGYYSRSKYDVPRDWLWEACHMARVRWEARCEGFCIKEGPHYWLEQSVRNQLECDQVRRVLEKSSGSCLLTRSNQPISRVRKSLRDSSPGLYCVDFAEAYIMRENVSSRIFMGKGMIHDCSMEVCLRNLCKERQNGERMPVLTLVPGSHEHLTLRKHVMCSRNMGVHVQRGIWSTKGMETG